MIFPKKCYLFNLFTSDDKQICTIDDIMNLQIYFRSFSKAVTDWGKKGKLETQKLENLGKHFL